MILCGGMGTRLREQTETRPKPMVEVGGKPMLWHIMKLYGHYGISEFILCLGYKGQVVKEYFLNYEAMNNDFTIRLGRERSVEYHSGEVDGQGWRVTLADTGERAGTGARIRRAVRYLGDDVVFAATYGDGVADLDLGAALAFHREHGRLATVTGVRPPGRFGEIRNDGSRVVGFAEKPQVGEGLINGGFFFFQRDFLRYLDDGDDCLLEREPLERAARDGQLQVFQHTGFWQCMDTYRDWENLEKLWSSGHPPWKVWT
jgi:glucose-1-phosphate cytidylyltransferase